jgi:uroporphyrinogen decarboxylase
VTVATKVATQPFLAACRREAAAHTPVWIMRQAGRYLPEYRKVREQVDFLTLTKTPDLAAEVTLQPVRRFGMDAAILFSDIMTPVEGMGVELEFAPGPVVAHTVRSAADVDALRVPDPKESVPFVLETIEILSRELPDSAPPGAADALLGKLADTMAAYLKAQAEAGAKALMLFDSWVGLLGPEEFRRFELPAVQRVLSQLEPLGIPLIYFPNQGATLLPDVRQSGAHVVGIDWRLPLSAARRTLGPELAVQGNLDPAALFAPRPELKRQIDLVLAEASDQPGHVFNLGHGIERTTDPDAVALLVDYVHERTAR